MYVQAIEFMHSMYSLQDRLYIYDNNQFLFNFQLDKRACIYHNAPQGEVVTGYAHTY